jgi:heme/copper-type cytochrome/quinol oxidase subunit 2
MPINVKVVTQEEFEAWTQQQQAAASNDNVKVAELAGPERR